MTHDVIIIGGGHNGLTAAALLGKHGRKVVVFEQRGALGGLASGDEFSPGYRTVGVLHDTALVRPQVVEQLELERHGLSRHSERTPVFAPEDDGPGLLLFDDRERTRDEIAAHSERDAERFAEFFAFVDRVGDYVRGILDAPPPAIAPRGLRGHWELLRKGWGLRRLGRDTMYECLRAGPMSVADWLGEYFETDLLNAALAAPAVLGTWTGPRAAGTAALLLMHECRAGPELAGGPAALVEALRRACETHGVEVRTGCTVRRILVERGAVSGVELDDGERVAAPAVLSSVDPRQTMLDRIEPRELPPELHGPLASWRCRGTTAKVDLALTGPLDFASRPDHVFEVIRVCGGLAEMERAFDPVKYRQIPEVPHLDIRVPTVRDPSLAPEGHHVASILVHYVPRDVDGGWTDAARELLLERTLTRLARVAPACRDLIAGHRVLTPADLERELGLSGGHVHHGEHGLDQMLSLRPAAACARYVTPVAGLFLCGSGSHPGGGITCAPGWLAAETFQKVPGTKSKGVYQRR